MAPLFDLAAVTGRPEDAFGAFIAWTAEQGLSLYPAQEEALLEVFSGAHVIVNTPTGSGKSLIALGGHIAALAAGKRSFYTAPVKALVSEKFFALCSDLGAENVGMLTGDASINPGAPIVCATAEIVANMALRSGADAPIDQVVMDEFHFYGDPDRGWAWQVPLLELTGAQFVLMSATLGDTAKIEGGLARRSGRPVSVVRSATRPVPLRFEYRRTPLTATIESLLADDQAPLYVVHFTQAQVLTHAQALTSAQVTTRAEREALAEALVGFRFAPGFGRDALASRCTTASASITAGCSRSTAVSSNASPRPACCAWWSAPIPSASGSTCHCEPWCSPAWQSTTARSRDF